MIQTGLIFNLKRVNVYNTKLLYYNTKLFYCNTKPIITQNFWKVIKKFKQTIITQKPIITQSFFFKSISLSFLFRFKKRNKLEKDQDFFPI